MMVEDEIIARRPKLSDGKRALLEKRLRGALKDRPRGPAIPRRAAGGNAPLSFAQQRLWFFDQLEPGSPLYNTPTALRLRGPLNLAALEKAINAIVARHESLRTRFEAEDGCPVQVVSPSTPVELPVTDLSFEPEAEREEIGRRLLNDEARRPFDLGRGGLVRAWLARLAPADHLLLINLHHMVSDAWSLEVFFRELYAFYEAFNADRKILLPELPIQYADYAVWQREGMRGETLEKQLTFWKRQLAGTPQFLELPTDKPRPPAPSFRGSHVERLLPKTLAAELKRLGQTEGATLFMTLLSALNILLHRYTRQAQLIIGTPIAGRTQLETEGLIGFFVNTLALRGDLSGDPTFRELLARVRQTTLDAFAHQDLPFERLVEELQPARSSGHTPLVQVMFVLQSQTARDAKLPALTVEPIAVDTGTAKFDLTVAAEERPDGLLVAAEFSTDLFTEATVARMLGQFQTLLENIAADPDRKTGELPLLTEAEQTQLLAGGSGAQTNYPRAKTIPQLFAEQAEKAPDAVAVIFGERRLTYRQLDERANRLARHLQKLGVGAGALVALCLERSAELPVALLGILKAGGAYVFLDPSSPKERLAFMLEDTRAPVLLTQEKFRGQFDFQSRTPNLVCLDTDREAFAAQTPSGPTGGADPGTPAYVSFTSGSTGSPKGVIVPHRGVVRLVKETNFARFGPEETFLQLAPVAFDASTLEIWGALLNGAKLVVFPPHTPSLAELGEFIRQNHITTLWLTAGLFHQMVEEQLESLKSVRQLLAGGDVLSPAHVKRALENLPGCKIINGYGPTENTTFTCCHEISPADCHGRSIPIGRPIANTQAYVLDDYGRPAPVGVPGELCVGGDGLALGYLNQPDLTAEKFVANPFASHSTARLYKTGDLVRWLPGGTLEFLGRLDQQVKIRGFRVEPGEIETVLNEHPAVRECAVAVWGEPAGEKQLAAYFVAESTPPPASDALRHHLRQRLPDYMIPSAFIPLPALPLNGNGKVNRRALPPPDQQSFRPAKRFVAPRNDVESRLAKIWAEVLGARRVGVEDHFFDLGGHSLLAVRLVARIEKAWGRKIPVSAVFESPTVAQLAQTLRDEKGTVAASSIVEIQPRGTKPPLFFVHGAGGGMLWGYTNLSRCLGADQPVLAFSSRGLRGQPEFTTIEEMAAQYVADLRAFQPRGPYYLGGYCFGGDVAYEMARQLQTQGEPVALLALMNCAPPNSSYARVRWTPPFILKFAGNFCAMVIAALRDTPEQRRAFFRWAGQSFKKNIMRGLQGRVGRRRKFPAPDMEHFVAEVQESLDLPAEVRGLWKAHLRALINYQPQPGVGRVTLLRNRCHPALCSFDPQCGWGELAAGGVTVKIVPGNHESILSEKNAPAAAAAIKECLAAAQAGQRKDNTP